MAGKLTAEAERVLRENLASFDAEVAFELENEGERADLWTDIDVPVEALRALLDELSRLREVERRAKEVIRPFAVGCSAHFNDWCPDEIPAWYDEGDEPGAEFKSAVTVGDFREARDFYRALSEREGQDG